MFMNIGIKWWHKTPGLGLTYDSDNSEPYMSWWGTGKTEEEIERTWHIGRLRFDLVALFTTTAKDKKQRIINIIEIMMDNPQSRAAPDFLRITKIPRQLEWEILVCSTLYHLSNVQLNEIVKILGNLAKYKYDNWFVD